MKGSFFGIFGILWDPSIIFLSLEDPPNATKDFLGLSRDFRRILGILVIFRIPLKDL